MRFYLFFSTILVCSNVGLQLWGRLDAHESHKLFCAPSGMEWIINEKYKYGEMFITGHVIQIIMQAVMLEKALYSVP